MTDIIVHYRNQVDAFIECDNGVAAELSDFFSFRADGYQFSPAFKNRIWDGYIRCFQAKTRTIPVGLLKYVEKFAKDREYTYSDNSDYRIQEQIPDDYGFQLAKDIGTGKYSPRDYQNSYVVNAIRNHRSLSLSPTSSGKSYIQYLIARHYIDTQDLNVLIIVPTTGLVSQMYNDFIDYGYDPNNMFKIQGGVDKSTGRKKKITISTWQSLQRSPKEFFDRFGVVLGDEAHKFTAKSLTGIMGKLVDCKYRHGFTGTIKSDSKCGKLTLEGVFGPVQKYVSTADLIKNGTVATFDIRAILLNHPTEKKKVFGKLLENIDTKKRYAAEREYLVNNVSRNRFITNLVSGLKNQNVLVLFDLVEKHGKALLPMFEEDQSRKVHFIHGGVDGDTREAIKQEVETDDIDRLVFGFEGGLEIPVDDGVMIGNRLAVEYQVGDPIDPKWIKSNLPPKIKMPASNSLVSVEFKRTPNKRHIVLASYGTTSTGWSCKRIDAVVFAFAGKAEITTLQSIGRVLRKGNGSDDATLYDIADDLLPGSKDNYTLGHFKKRLGFYAAEKFRFKILELDLGSSDLK